VNVLGCGLALSLLLSGCSMFQPPIKQIEISAKPIEKPKLVLPNVDPVNMRKIEWTIITEENFQEVLQKARETGRPISFFALTDEGYENLGLNLSDIRALVQQQQAIIAAYQGYYVQSNEAIEQANEDLEDTNRKVEAGNRAIQRAPSWQFWR
jgi:hypothetical protein